MAYSKITLLIAILLLLGSESVNAITFDFCVGFVKSLIICINLITAFCIFSSVFDINT